MISRFTLAIVLFYVSLGNVNAQSFTYRVTDPMVGTSNDDLNTQFWSPWSYPDQCQNGAVAVTQQGTVFSGQLNYLGLTGWPSSQWVLKGDFRISLYVSNDTPDRTHVTVYEILNCEEWGPALIGLWGGGSPANPNHFNMLPPDAAYYLFVKEGDQLYIQKGDESGVSEDDPIVQGPITVKSDGDYIFFIGTGCTNFGQLTVRDLAIDTEQMASCPAGTTIPDDWLVNRDSDKDGVPNERDHCPNTLSGVAVDKNGCSIEQLCDCDQTSNHGQYVSCIAQTANAFVRAGLVDKKDRGKIIAAAAHSQCGK